MRENNFNLLRMIAASAVIVSHSYPLSLGAGTSEPLEAVLTFSLGALAVKMFFATSGFLIMQSWERRQSVVTFAVARYARIVPGLLTVLLLMAFLPSFANNPLPGAKNGALWTLWYEAGCYLTLAAVGLRGFYRTFLFAYAAFYVAVRTGTIPFDPAIAFLSLPFIFGAAVQKLRIPLRGWLAASLFVFPVAAWQLEMRSEELWALAASYAALWIGNARWFPAYNRLGDYSYGTYIFGWPVQQMVVLFVVGITPLALMLFALPIAWCLGALSWNFIENPALRWAKSKMPLIETSWRNVIGQRSALIDATSSGAVA